MKKYVLKVSISLFLITIIGQMVYSQSKNNKDSIEIHKVVMLLFDGMREGDSLKVHEAFSDNLQLISTSVSKNGETQIQTEELNGLLSAVGSPHDKIWDEKITPISINIDGAIAQYWVYYKFFVGNEFSHCGIDAFQLVKMKGKWEIVSLLDTRKKKGCD